MRTLAALALILVACSSGDSTEDSGATSANLPASAAGPEPAVLRVPLSGGVGRVHMYPALDSVAWSSSSALPVPGEVIAFDPVTGVLALADTTGRPAWVDLRLDATGRAPRDLTLAGLEAGGDAQVYGIGADGRVVRAGARGDRWEFEPPVAATRVAPQPDGWLLVFADDGEATRIWRLRPPQTRITDSTIVPLASLVAQSAVGDRIYVAADRDLLILNARDLSALPTISFRQPVSALAATPSGDRVFVVENGSSELSIVDRYAAEVTRRISMPSGVRDLRVDPYGRYLLARPESGDSAWVITLATGELSGSVRTAWRDDLPYVAPDGSIVLATGDDVTIVSGASLRATRTVSGGSADLWFAFAWDGFRPRSGRDDVAAAPETVRPPDPDPEPADTLAMDADSLAGADTLAGVGQRADSADADTLREPAPGFMVSFAALLSEESARELAAQITVDGRNPRVVPTERSGSTIYRVLFGPYPTRDEAERVGREAGHSYWVYEENG